MLPLAVLIAVSPWHGRDLPTATQAAAKYRLTIAGKPGERVHLRTAGVARGWIAAFCDNRTCSPGELRATLPASGKLTLQFELIRETDDAPRRSGARILGDGAAVTIPAASHEEPGSTSPPAERSTRPPTRP